MRLHALFLMGILVAACDGHPFAPIDQAPTLGATAGLQTQSDSMVKTAYAFWEADSIQHFVQVAEGTIDGQRGVWLGYSGYDYSWQEVYRGYGPIPAKDVTGSGIGALHVRTNTSPEANPDFFHSNDPGGIVDVAWNQIPQTAWKYHEVGRFEALPFVFTYNTTSQQRDARVEGVVVGRVVPDSVGAYLGLAIARNMVLLVP